MEDMRLNQLSLPKRLPNPLSPRVLRDGLASFSDSMVARRVCDRLSSSTRTRRATRSSAGSVSRLPADFSERIERPS